MPPACPSKPGPQHCQIRDYSKAVLPASDPLSGQLVLLFLSLLPCSHCSPRTGSKGPFHTLPEPSVPHLVAYLHSGALETQSRWPLPPSFLPLQAPQWVAPELSQLAPHPEPLF